MVKIDNIAEIMNTSSNAPQIQALGRKTGVEPNTVSKLAMLAIPLILRAISKNMESKEGKDSLHSTLEKHRGKTKSATSIEDLVSQADTEDGDKILGHAFDNKDQVVDQISRQTGINKNDIGKVLASMAPIILAALADKKEERNLDPDGVAKQTDIFRQEAEEKASSNFDLNDLFPQAKNEQGGGLGGILGGILGNLF